MRHDRRPRLGLLFSVGALIATSAALGQQTALSTHDGLGLMLADDGRVSGVTLDGRPLPGGATGGFTAIDVARGGRSAAVRGSLTRDADAVALIGKAAELDIALSVRYEVAPTFIRAHCTVRDLTGEDRGLVVHFALPLDAVGWRWWQDMQTTQAIEAGNVYEDASGARAFPGIAEYMGQPGLDVGRHSRLFCSAVTAAGGPAAGGTPAPRGGLSFAAPLDEFRIFRTGYDAAKKQLYIAYDLALCKETKVPSEASFTFLIQRVDPKWGLRDALSRYYATYPQLFTKIVDARKQREGIWMPFEDLENIDNANEFGFGVQEGAPNPPYDDRLRVDSLPYYGGGNEVFWVPNYKPGKDPVPPYQTLVDLFNKTLDERYSLKNAYSEACSYDKDGKCAMSDAAPYGHFGSQLDSNPAYQYGQALLKNMDAYFASWQSRGARLDGVYYDGLAAGLDYNRAHFKDASFPPIWDPVARKPLLYNYFSSLDFARAASEKLHAESRVAMTNGAMSSDMFGAPYLDYMGEETGLTIPRNGFNFVRSICYRKTFMTLLKGDYTAYTHADIERYMQRCVAYGVFPGFFDWYTSGTGPGSSYWVHPEYYDRDRDLFRKYIPLCRRIASAGWEPLTLAECDNPRVFVERWGRAADRDLAFTLLSESTDTERGTLTLPKALGLAGAKDLIAFDQVAGRKLELKTAGDGLKVAVSLPPEGFALLQVMPRQAFIAGQAQAIKDVIAAGELQAKLDGERKRPDLPRFWVPTYGARSYGGSIGRVGHGGRYSLAFDHSRDARRRDSVYTWVNLHQKLAQAFTISAWSRAEGVDDKRDDNYALKFTTCHVTNYTEETPHVLQFEPGTHDWQQVSVTFRPTETIDAVQLAPTFEGHAGTVWFDDVTLTTGDGKQWVYDPGFEQWDCRPSPGQEVPDGFADITKAADALAAGADPLAALGKILNASLFPHQLDEIRSVPDAFERQNRDLADCKRFANLTLAGLYQLPTVVLDAPARVVPGDSVPVKVRLEGASDLKLDPPAFSLSALGKTSQQRGASAQFAMQVPKDAPLGQSVPVRAQAQMWANRKVLLTLEATGVLVVAPRAAGDLEVVDIVDDGMTFVAETTLQNNGNRPVECALEPVAPQGWTAAGPKSLSTAPQAEGRARFAFRAATDATMGRYTFTVRATIPGERRADRNAAAWFLPPKANRLADPGFEDNDGKTARGWAAYEKGYTLAAGAHTGKACIKCANPDGEGAFGALQGVSLQQKVATPIVVRAFSKCEGVPGAPDASYSVYVDLYYTDGTALYGQTLDFATGTHGWQCMERVIEPAKPVATANVYAFVRGRRGTVYFDDIALAEDETQKGNVALASLGTKVVTDSNYTEYTPAPLTDGVTDTTGLDWRQAAWASADSDSEHWIELTFPKPTTVSRVAIYWNAENKVTYTSRNYQVQAWVNRAWQTVAAVQGQAVMPVSAHTFAPVTTEKLRILQASGGGYADRPNVMWVSEVKAF